MLTELELLILQYCDDCPFKRLEELTSGQFLNRVRRFGLEMHKCAFLFKKKSMNRKITEED